MKSIILTDESHLAAADCEGVVFERGVPQLVDDARAEVILRHPWFAEAPAEKPAEKPAPLVVREPSEPAK